MKMMYYKNTWLWDSEITGSADVGVEVQKKKKKKNINYRKGVIYIITLYVALTLNFRFCTREDYYNKDSV